MNHPIAALSLFFLFLWTFVVKVLQNEIVDMLWFCHISLLLAAIALTLRNKPLINGILIGNLLIFTVWLVDILLALIGAPSLGVMIFLLNGSWFNISHLLLVPLLLFVIFKEGTTKRELFQGLIMASSLFLIVSSASFFFSNPVTNMNSAFYPAIALFDFPIVPYASWQYLIGLNVFVAVFLFLPAASIISNTITRKNSENTETP